MFAAPSYIARAGTPRTFTDLAQHDWALIHPRLRGRAALGFSAPGHATVPTNTRIDGNEFLFLRSVLRASGGVGVLPPFVAAADVAAGTLIRLLPDWSSPWVHLYVVYPANHPRRRLASSFADFVIRHMRQRNFVLIPNGS